MKCFYINLDRATSRRESIERLFSTYRSPNWTLERFAAVDTVYVNEKKIRGGLTDVEKACYLSHKKIIQQNLDSKEYVWIFEDDITFSKHTFNLIDNFVSQSQNGVEWDFLYTDIGVPTIGIMADLFELRRKLMEGKSVELINLRQIPFFGTTSYIINPNSIRKVAALLDDADLNIPLDLHYRKLSMEGKLNAFVTFPYLTSDSEEAANSSIQSSEFAQTDLIWALFRKLTWLDGDSFDPTTLLNEVWVGLEKRTQLYGVLWAAMADPKFKLK